MNWGHSAWLWWIGSAFHAALFFDGGSIFYVVLSAMHALVAKILWDAHAIDVKKGGGNAPPD